MKQRKLLFSQRLTLTYSGILFCILVIFTVFITSGVRFIIIKSSQSENTLRLNQISDSLARMQKLDRSAFEGLDKSLGIAFSIFDENKQLVYSSRPGLPKMQVLLENTNKLVIEKVAGGEAPHVYDNREIKLQGAIYYIQVAKNFDDFVEKAKFFPGLILLPIFGGTVICFISGIFLTSRFIRPIRDISQKAREITSRNLHQRIVTDGPEDELTELAGIFNSMFGRLEEDFEKQRRFIADASHELRTPLAVIHGRVNMLRRWGKNDPDVLDKSLDILKAETEYMNRLIENLLYLAKSDNNQLKINKNEFALDILLKEVADEARLLHNTCSVTVGCAANLRITADYDAMKQVLRILVDNSIKYSSPSDEITITGTAKEKQVCIMVRDHGIGIPSDSLPHIFDRFYRVDESRSRATGGSGLGLSIAKQIVQSHDGKISAESEPGKGTTITICIPV